MCICENALSSFTFTYYLYNMARDNKSSISKSNVAPKRLARSNRNKISGRKSLQEFWRRLNDSPAIRQNRPFVNDVEMVEAESTELLNEVHEESQDEEDTANSSEEEEIDESACIDTEEDSFAPSEKGKPIHADKTSSC